MAIGIDVSSSSTYLQKKVAAQVRPLQLCICGVVVVVVLLICAIFGFTYEADSIDLIQHDLEVANSTASHLGSAHDSLERRLQSTQQQAIFAMRHRDSQLNKLKEQADKCDLSLKICKQKVKQEALQIEDEKEVESELEKEISAHMLSMSKLTIKHESLTKVATEANNTVKRLQDELHQVKQTHKDEIQRLENEHQKIQYGHGGKLFSLKVDLKRKMAQKQSLRICIAVVVCLFVLPLGGYLMLTSGRFSSLKFGAKRFMEP